jgi:hypothetical protein
VEIAGEITGNIPYREPGKDRLRQTGKYDPLRGQTEQWNQGEA